jgi:3-phenylpropionate/trans-cinnamate dioxygenase ferredoxin subunit
VWEEDECVAVCPRHGSRFDIRTGRPLTLPAYQPVDTFPVTVVDGWVRVDVD